MKIYVSEKEFNKRQLEELTDRGSTSLRTPNDFSGYVNQEVNSLEQHDEEIRKQEREKVIAELKQEYNKKINKLAKIEDEELCHIELDNLLCELLEELGFKEIVDVFKNSEKWYS